MQIPNSLQFIARIQNDFQSKFGIPRQSSLLSNYHSTIIFEKEFRDSNTLRGLEGFSHLWLLWYFSENKDFEWSPTVRPPRLGGNKRMGVFATRSPFRPNPIGLSCVGLEEIKLDGKNGPELIVSGADLKNDTPIIDIKPYLPYCDSIPEAAGGFAMPLFENSLKVIYEENILERFPESKRKNLLEILAQDPRPGYQNEPQRIYGFTFANYEIRFQVKNNILEILDIQKINSSLE